MPTKFQTEVTVRPDDIDMNQHVHNSIYLDYVLAARYDQMERCYKMSMEEFINLGYSWVSRDATIEWLRPLKMTDVAVVTTWVEDIRGSVVLVKFEIHIKATGKLASRGQLNYVLVDLRSGRPRGIPPEVVEKYSV